MWEGELALLWQEPASSDTVRLRIAFAGEPAYRRAEVYMHRLIKESAPWAEREESAGAGALEG